MTFFAKSLTKEAKTNYSGKSPLSIKMPQSLYILSRNTLFSHSYYKNLVTAKYDKSFGSMKLRHFLAISILTKIDPPQKNIVKTIFTKTTYFSGMALPPDIFRDSLVTVSLFHMEKKLFCLKSLIKFSVYIR